MTPEENKAIVNQFYDELFNKKNIDYIDQIVSPDFVDHNPEPDQGPGVEGVKQGFTVFANAFPDMTVNVDLQVAEKDYVASRITVKGTHTGEMKGMPPTNKPMTITGIDIIRFQDNKCVERWGDFDQLGMMQQLGAIPEPEQATE